MTVFQAELKYFIRSPLIWLVAAIFAFVSAWSFLLLLDLYQQNQVKFAGMSDAPTIYEGIIYPAFQTQAKFMLVVSSILGGLSYARYYQNNAWSFVQQSQLGHLKFISSKLLALLIISLLFILPLTIASLMLIVFTDLSLWPLFKALSGMGLLLLWMLSFSMLVSIFSHNSGFAILLSIILLILFWLLSQQSLDASWGKNWIITFSPDYHFKQFFSHYLSFASLFYFTSGSLLFIWAIQIKLIHKRTAL